MVCNVWVGVDIDVADSFFGLPRCGYFTVGVPCIEESYEVGAALVVEAFVGCGKEATDPVQRIASVSAVSHCFVLDPAAAFIEFGVGEVRSGRSALPAFLLAGLSGPSPEPDVRLLPHPALHESVPLAQSVVVIWSHGVGIFAPR